MVKEGKILYGGVEIYGDIWVWDWVVGWVVVLVDEGLLGIVNFCFLWGMMKLCWDNV